MAKDNKPPSKSCKKLQCFFDRVVDKASTKQLTSKNKYPLPSPQTLLRVVDGASLENIASTSNNITPLPSRHKFPRMSKSVENRDGFKTPSLSSSLGDSCGEKNDLTGEDKLNEGSSSKGSSKRKKGQWVVGRNFQPNWVSRLPFIEPLSAMVKIGSKVVSEAK